MLRLLSYPLRRKSSIHERVTEKYIHPSFVVPCQTAKVTATVHSKCLVKVEMALNLLNTKFILTEQHLVPESIEPIQMFQPGIPEMSDTKPFTESKKCLQKFRNIFVLEI